MRNKNLLQTFVLVALVFSAVSMIGRVSSSPEPKLYVDPPAVKADPNQTFTISVKIAEATDVFSWSFMIYWNSTLLDATEVVEGGFLRNQPEGTNFIAKINQTEGYVDVACSTRGDYYGVDGSGTLATVTFLVQGLGETELNFQRTKLLNHFVEVIPHTTVDGYFANVLLHDVAVTDISVYPTAIEAGELVQINVTVQNQGGFTETFNVTTYYDGNAIETRFDVTLNPAAETILDFVWNTTGLAGGHYKIKATASILKREADTADNTLVKGTVSIPKHDISVISVTPSPEIVTVGQTVSIDVEVKNIGDFTETFSVTTYYDGTSIDEETVTALEPNTTKTLTFTWDTANVPAGSYMIKAVASSVPGEVSTADNTFVTHWTNSVEVKQGGQAFPIEIVGVGIAIGIGALVIVAFMFTRRHSSSK